jgi:hypothetical protein
MNQARRSAHLLFHIDERVVGRRHLALDFGNWTKSTTGQVTYDLKTPNDLPAIELRGRAIAPTLKKMAATKLSFMIKE